MFSTHAVFRSRDSLDERQLKLTLFISSVWLKNTFFYKDYLLQSRGEIHTGRPFHSLRSDCWENQGQGLVRSVNVETKGAYRSSVAGHLLYLVRLAKLNKCVSVFSSWHEKSIPYIKALVNGIRNRLTSP